MFVYFASRRCQLLVAGACQVNEHCVYVCCSDCQAMANSTGLLQYKLRPK
jgi:hypothetical protein